MINQPSQTRHSVVLLQQYAALQASVSTTAFDHTHEWFDCYFRHISNDGLNVIQTWDDADTLTGMLFVKEGYSRYGSMGSMGGMRAKELSSVANYYTASVAPAVKGGMLGQKHFANAYAKHAERFDVVSLAPLDATGEFTRALSSALSRNGFVIDVSTSFRNWFLTLNRRSFAEYRIDLPSTLRNTLSRKRRKLMRERQMRISVAKTVKRTEFEAYLRIHQSSWKPVESHPEFIWDIMQRFSAASWLRFGLLHVDGVAAAAQIWFIKDDTASIFKLAYDPKFAQYSVGSLLTEEMMRYVIDEDRVAVVDFLSGDDAYKRDWMSDVRERKRLRAFNPQTPKGRVLGLGLKAKRWLTPAE